MFSTKAFITFLTASATFASAASLSALKRDADNGSCAQLERICVGEVSTQTLDLWAHNACLFGASCFGGQVPVDGFVASAWSSDGGNGTAPASLNLTRVTTDAFNSISTDGQSVTQQNFIDGYYSALDATGGPYPTDASIVIDDFDRLASWTGFCPGTGQGIPYQNFADYYQYSSSVDSTAC
ncbi:uncharacterized protein STEHIDRAFT_108126 [Stereum hirsutum FP-91666 SS1]|uniref:uncharacterized protein n=1 Tax=Stereum hirsutum (strain FP-91666) TaxID=721885 RepID=UPI000440A2E9|nr:uncharacterized protein STEHIDRAFT_108126 [Stereum hirsutum FP-91666 SS1]EIM91609.1 hypothetical protein STEHIDRAFT_108126 [Stereum hirsutum FP-91666 SS1]